jgi:hypothetical protein
MESQKETDVVIEGVEPQEELTQVVVDLDKKPVSKQADQPKEPPKPQQDFSKLNNTIAYQTRQLEKAMRELDEMRKQIASRPVQTAPASEPADEIDEIAQKDWKQGVKRVVLPEVQAEIKQEFERREQERQKKEREAAAEAELDRSKKRVMERYPTVEEEGSEEQRVYLEVLNEDKSLLSNIHGPEIAMYRMEDRLRQMGRTPSSLKPIVDREVNRLARAGASSVVGHQASPNGKITLSKEQREFCDHYNIPYEQYAKNLKAQAGGAE